MERTRAQESRAAIEKLYITMRHLFNRGFYKPMGVSGETLRESLLILRPEIYGSIAEEKMELSGLLYVMDRLPIGIEECRYINLTSDEGYANSHFKPIVPLKRRRNCYRIDEEQMNIEVTRGRSEIYDILTHLTFLYIEAEKIKRYAIDENGKKTREWIRLEEIVKDNYTLVENEKELALVYLSAILGRTYEETEAAYTRFNSSGLNNNLFHIIYWLGRIAIEEQLYEKDREINFSSALRERIGHHIYGERWASNIKRFLYDKNLINRPIHIISANLHSVMNALYAYPAIAGKFSNKKDLFELAIELSQPQNDGLRKKVEDYAYKHGLYFLKDNSKTNISVQIINTSKLDLDQISPEVNFDSEYIKKEKPVIVVMDYAFGEQAYETMDELLKPFEKGDEKIPLPVKSVSIIGKAGILEGEKGDIMVPTAHIFEGTADNYPIDNAFQLAAFDGSIKVFHGPMITVLGTSLQNKDVLDYFDKNDFFIFNDTKVFPAKLYGNKEKTGAKIEVFLLRELNPDQHLWDVLVNPARKIRIGNKLYFGENEELVAEVIDNTTSRGRTLRFLYDGPYEEFKEQLFQIGETPIPDYLDREAEPDDVDRYQNIFAENEGAVVVPAAGLHFSRELIHRMRLKDIEYGFLTLHNGLGAYRMIDVEDLSKHKMESEQISISAELCNKVNKAYDNGQNICAVGTSVLRAVETTVSTDGHLKPREGWTNRFIFPPYDFTLTNSLITNFNLPYSTLLMMTCAFGGYDRIMDVYQTAIKEKYRFGAYGDAMLIID